MPYNVLLTPAEHSLINIKPLVFCPILIKTFACSNEPHVWVITPLLSGSWSQECFLQLWNLEYLKINASSANAVAHSPPVSFTCYHTAVSSGHFRLLHHMSPGYNSCRTWGIVFHRRGEMALQDCLKKSPGT